jgi:hypothetical protein
MLYPMRVLHIAKALSEGRFGQIYCLSANAYRPVAPISLIKFKDNKSFLSRSTYQLHPICTPSDNLDTPSLAPRGIHVRNCFTKVLTLQNRKDRGLSGRQIHLHTNPKQMENLL